MSGQRSTRDFLPATMRLRTTPCDSCGISSVRVFRRNYDFAPTVYINEMPALGGPASLETYRPVD